MQGAERNGRRLLDANQEGVVHTDVELSCEPLADEHSVPSDHEIVRRGSVETPEALIDPKDLDPRCTSTTLLMGHKSFDGDHRNNGSEELGGVLSYLHAIGKRLLDEPCARNHDINASQSLERKRS